MNTRILLVSLLMLLLIAAAGYYRFSPPPLAKVPDITLVSVDGEELQLPAYRGKPLLVTFWSTTCPACVKEIPHLIDLYRELAPRGGLEIIGIAMAHDPPDQVLAMRNRITSYNVCYTKLLRALNHFIPPLPGHSSTTETSSRHQKAILMARWLTGASFPAAGLL